MKKLVLILFIFIVASCTTKQEHENKLDSWIGVKESGFN